MRATSLDFGKMKDISCETNGDIFQYILEYDGTLYHLVLEYNDNYHPNGCIENKCFQKLRETEEAEISDSYFDAIQDGIDECLQLFWSHIEKYHTNLDKNENGVNDPNETVKIRLVTCNNQLQAVSHNCELQMSTVEPVDVPIPDMVRTFRKQSVKRLAKIENGIFKVEVSGKEYCLKTVYRERKERFLYELAALSKLPPHQNIVALEGVIVVDDGRIEGVLLQYIDGNLLSSVTSITSFQASKWKLQLSEAVQCLHSKKAVWGDAKPANVIVDKKTDSIFLIDFGGGWSPGWVDPEKCETVEGDIEGVMRIHAFIDKLVTKAEGAAPVDCVSRRSETTP